MTVLIGWIGVDSRRPCSAYLLSDSRASWGQNLSTYDYCRKLFALNNSPDILGYCGDILFSSLVLSQIASLDENELLFSRGLPSKERSDVILRQINRQFCDYPSPARQPSSIFHISRDIDNSFRAYKYDYKTATREWERQEETISCEVDHSSVIIVAGSGADEFRLRYSVYQSGELTNTSRNVFQCFCDTLSHTGLTSCGGAPQMVGLYNGKNNGISFGIIYHGQRFFLGSPLERCPSDDSTRWYNENFEICDGITMERKPTAMIQPKNRLK